MKPLSLRTRLLAGLGAAAIMLGVATIAVTVTTRRHLTAQVDDRLAAAAALDHGDRFDDHDNGRDYPGPTQEYGVAPGVRPERFSSFFEGLILTDGTLITFFAPNGPDETTSPPELESVDFAEDNGIFTVDSLDGELRYRVLATDTRLGTAVRALPLTDVDETVHKMVLLQAIGVASVLAVLAAVGWWVIRLGVRPLRQMTITAAEISGGDLNTRLVESAAAGTEAGDLAITLNAMLTRTEDAVNEQIQSERRLRRFVADASHELRTPITTIQGYAELYELGGLDGEDALDDAIHRTKVESQRMGRLIEEMLLLAKLDQQRPLATDPVDITQLLQDTVSDAGVTAPLRHLVTEINPELIVPGDEDRLRQVFGNLVGNALTHTPDDAAITINAYSEGGLVVVTVADEGPGMSNDVAERITERFYRADSSRSREQGGNGLGLSISESIVQAHGGSLSVQSEPDAGTTIQIELPINRSVSTLDSMGHSGEND